MYKIWVIYGLDEGDMFFDTLVLLNFYVSVSYSIGWNGWNSIFGKIIVIVCWSVDLTEDSMPLSVSIVLHSIIIGWRLNKKARHCDVTGLS